jgi:serine/threonine-protein kinase RsbT
MSAMGESKSIAIRNDLDIITARVEGRNLAKELGFSTIDQARIATAISELARNVVLYALEGTVTVVIVKAGGRRGLEAVCEDNGPGIEDVELALQDGYSTSRGLGKGLPGAKRLVDEFEIESTLGKGTKVVIRKWLR